MKRKTLVLGVSLALLLAFTTVSAYAQLEPLFFGLVGAGVGLAASGGNPAGAAIGGAIGVGTGIAVSAANAHAGYGYYGGYGYGGGYYRPSYYPRAYVEPGFVVRSHEYGPRYHYRARHYQDRNWVRTYPHRDRYDGYRGRYMRDGYTHNGYREDREARLNNRWR